MVDEFSSFARLPAPVMREEELVDLVKRAVFPQRVANPNIDYQISLPDDPVLSLGDARLIGPALTNLLKNAAEAISAKEASLESEPGPADFGGKIDVTLSYEHERLFIAVVDNGCGLPKEERHKLTEPYITTRAKGTGLGLAIVKKIMEDHGGELILEDGGDGGGARVTLNFPRIEAEEPIAEEHEDAPTPETVDAEVLEANGKADRMF